MIKSNLNFKIKIRIRALGVDLIDSRNPEELFYLHLTNLKITVENHDFETKLNATAEKFEVDNQICFARNAVLLLSKKSGYDISDALRVSFSIAKNVTNMIYFHKIGVKACALALFLDKNVVIRLIDYLAALRALKSSMVFGKNNVKDDNGMGTGVKSSDWDKLMCSQRKLYFKIFFSFYNNVVTEIKLK